MAARYDQMLTEALKYAAEGRSVLIVSSSFSRSVDLRRRTEQALAGIVSIVGATVTDLRLPAGRLVFRSANNSDALRGYSVQYNPVGRDEWELIDWNPPRPRSLILDRFNREDPV